MRRTLYWSVSYIILLEISLQHYIENVIKYFFQLNYQVNFSLYLMEKVDLAFISRRLLHITTLGNYTKYDI